MIILIVCALAYSNKRGISTREKRKSPSVFSHTHAVTRRCLIFRFESCASRKVKVTLTSSSSGSLVTRCMGRMRNEIMGRPPHSLLPSICFSVSLNTVLLVLGDTKKRGNSAHSATLLRKPNSTFQLVLLLTAASAASSAGRSRWSSRQCRAQSGGQHGSEQYR